MGDHTIAADVISRDSREILDSIRRLVQELRTADRESEHKLGLSGAQLFVIQKLGEESVMSVNDLAERTWTHQSSVSVVVQRLVEKGLVKRKESRTDRRRVELSLTSEGKKLLTHSHYIPQERLIEAIESMKSNERKQLSALLRAVVETMGISSHAPGMFFEAESKPDTPARKAR
jgi:DNA-binding MarR family transcriptional regulator